MSQFQDPNSQNGETVEEIVSWASRYVSDPIVKAQATSSKNTSAVTNPWIRQELSALSSRSASLPSRLNELFPTVLKLDDPLFRAPIGHQIESIALLSGRLEADADGDMDCFSSEEVDVRILLRGTDRSNTTETVGERNTRAISGRSKVQGDMTDVDGRFTINLSLGPLLSRSFDAFTFRGVAHPAAYSRGSASSPSTELITYDFRQTSSGPNVTWTVISDLPDPTGWEADWRELRNTIWPRQ